MKLKFEKNQSWRYVIIIPLAFFLVSCGKSGDEAMSANDTDAPKSDPVIAKSTSNPVPNNTGTGTVTPPATTPDTCNPATQNCNPSIPGPNSPTLSVNGYGNSVKLASTGQSIVSAAKVVSIPEYLQSDQVFKIQIKPLKASSTIGSSATNQYEKLAVTVDFYNGDYTATNLPAQSAMTVDLSSDFPEGISVGSKSNIIDFFPVLNGSKKHTIRISNARSNYGCKTFCDANFIYEATLKSNPVCAYDYNYYTYCWAGPKYGYWDAYRRCCVANPNVLSQQTTTCNNNNCPITAVQNNAGWGVEILIETDRTVRLTQ